MDILLIFKSILLAVTVVGAIYYFATTLTLAVDGRKMNWLLTLCATCTVALIILTVIIGTDILKSKYSPDKFERITEPIYRKVR